MHSNLDYIVLIAGVLLLLSVTSSKLSSSFGVPSLVLFVFVGMLAGSEGVGGIYFDNYNFAHGLGTVALVLILFGGGLDTEWRCIRPILWHGIMLATIGVALTAALVGAASHYLLGVSYTEGLLLGAIVSSTDAAAVFGVLRAQGLKLKGSLAALLELESGSNDPMAVYLTIALTALLLGHVSNPWNILTDLGIEMFLGTLGGVLLGVLTAKLINRLQLAFDGLYPVLTIALALISYAGVQAVGGSGFLSVYVCGLVLGGRNFLHRISLIQFHEGLGWLMQIAMFLCLGLLVFPYKLLDNIGTNLCLAAFLIFIARPVAVLLALLPFKGLNMPERLFVSWVGLKGAVPIILAIIPLMHSLPNAQLIFNQVFFIVLVSVVVQGMSVRWVAAKLGVIDLDSTHVNEKRIAASMIEVKIPPGSPVIGKAVVDLELPPQTLLVMLTRNQQSSIPRGATVLQANDTLLIHTMGESVHDMQRAFIGK